MGWFKDVPSGYYNSHECPEWGPCSACERQREQKRKEEKERQRNNPTFKGYFEHSPSLFDCDDSGVDEIPNHHFIGECIITKESKHAIYCDFDMEPIGIKKWGKKNARWVPRSQVADNKLGPYPDEESLSPYSKKGDRGTLWISGWLKTRWNLNKTTNT